MKNCDFRTNCRLWITPNGELISCKMYEHIEVIKDEHHLQKSIKHVLKEIEKIKEKKLSLSPKNEEWDICETAEVEAYHRIRMLAFQENYLIVNVDPRITLVEVQGTCEGIQSNIIKILKIRSEAELETQKDFKLSLQVFEIDEGGYFRGCTNKQY